MRCLQALHLPHRRIAWGRQRGWLCAMSGVEAGASQAFGSYQPAVGVQASSKSPLGRKGSHRTGDPEHQSPRRRLGGMSGGAWGAWRVPLGGGQPLRAEAATLGSLARSSAPSHDHQPQGMAPEHHARRAARQQPVGGRAVPPLAAPPLAACSTLRAQHSPPPTQTAVQAGRPSPGRGARGAAGAPPMAWPSPGSAPRGRPRRL